jgi:hypothetical protein
MIRGFIDFDILDRTQVFDRLPQNRGIHTRISTELSADIKTFSRNQQALLILGQPRIRDAGLAGRIERDGWAASVPQLCESLTNF